jgi:hypothetical protein
LRHYAASRKVAASITNEDIEFFLITYSFQQHYMTLGFTQLLRNVSTRYLPGGGGHTGNSESETVLDRGGLLGDGLVFLLLRRST